MAWSAYLGGVDHTADIDQAAPVTIVLTLNGRARATFRCLPGYAPDRFDPVLFYGQDGTTPLFGGLVLQRRMRGLVPGAESAFTECEAVGLGAALDWATVTLTFATDPTLQEVLDAIFAALPASYGLTLDGTDYSGTTLSAFSWTNVRASDALRELCERTGRVYSESPTGVIALPLPGGLPAPFTVTDGAPHCREVVWSDPADPPVTTIQLLCGTGQAVYTQRWVSDGGSGPWVADVPAAGPGGYWVVTLNPPGNLYLTVDDGAGGGMMSWDWTTRTLTSNIGAITAGTELIFPYTAQFPFTVTAQSGVSPLPTPDVVRVYERPDLFDPAQAQEIADGLLAQESAVAARQIELSTLEGGWRPGQELVATLTGRALNVTCAITQVEITLTSDAVWSYVVTAVELTVYGGGYLAAWRALLAGSSSGAGAAVTNLEGEVTVLALPSPYFLGGSRFHAVQVPA